MYSYGRVKALTEQLMDEALKLLSEPADAPVTLTQNHDLIRQGDDYADLFSLAAKQSAALPASQTPRYRHTQPRTRPHDDHHEHD